MINSVININIHIFMYELIKWPTFKTIINYILVLFSFKVFFRLRL